MDRAGRRQKLSHFNRVWLGTTAVAIALVATSVIGLATTDGSGEPGETSGSLQLILFVALGGLGAVIGLLATIVRAKRGDDVDEAGLDTPPDQL